MRVLHLISSGGMYGAEAVILSLSRVLERDGDRSLVASFGNASLELHGRALAEGLQACVVPCHGQLSRSTLRAIRELVERERVDVLHAHGYKADLYAWAALRKRGVPLVSTCHTWYDNNLALWVYGALDRRVLRSYARVAAVSADVEGRLLSSGVSGTRVRRVRNGIDVTPFATVAAKRGSEPGRALRVGLVGRLSREKGVDVFIDAAATVANSLPEVEFVVVGEGPDRPQLEEQIRTKRLVDRIRLLGHEDAMVPVYAGLDLLVSASRREGLPVALLEGMASGLPLVGTTAGEVPTVVVQGQTGLLVAPDDAAALAEVVLQMLTRHDQRLAWGQNAHERIQREFSAERMAAEYRELYRDALEQGGRAA